MGTSMPSSTQPTQKIAVYMPPSRSMNSSNSWFFSAVQMLVRW